LSDSHHIQTKLWHLLSTSLAIMKQVALPCPLNAKECVFCKLYIFAHATKQRMTYTVFPKEPNIKHAPKGTQLPENGDTRLALAPSGEEGVRYESATADLHMSGKPSINGWSKSFTCRAIPQDMRCGRTAPSKGKTWAAKPIYNYMNIYRYV
jgi:hypothetical protein